MMSETTFSSSTRLIASLFTNNLIFLGWNPDRIPRDLMSKVMLEEIVSTTIDSNMAVGCLA